MIEEATLTPEELWESAKFRSKIYGFLSSLYMQIPSHNLVNALLCGEVSSFLSTLPQKVGPTRDIEEGLADILRFITTSSGQAVEEVHQNLCVEYTRLFRGIMPGYSPPPPYESVYRDEGRVLMGKSAVEVRRRYAEAGVDVPAECGDLPDYVGLELDFMRFLAEQEAESWRKRERDSALGYLDMERGFLTDHIMKWVPRFCDKVVDVAEFDFYRGIARMTKGFLNEDYGKIKGVADIIRQK
jgi:TorA maturation chaperone TorD